MRRRNDRERPGIHPALRPTSEADGSAPLGRRLRRRDVVLENVGNGNGSPIRLRRQKRPCGPFTAIPGLRRDRR